MSMSMRERERGGIVGKKGFMEEGGGMKVMW